MATWLGFVPSLQVTLRSRGGPSETIFFYPPALPVGGLMCSPPFSGLHKDLMQ